MHVILRLNLRLVAPGFILQPAGYGELTLKSKWDRYKDGYLQRWLSAEGRPLPWLRMGISDQCSHAVQNGIRNTQYLTFSGAEFPTERLARIKLQGLLLSVNDGKMANYTQVVHFDTLLHRYIAEEMPPKSSTRLDRKPDAALTFDSRGMRHLDYGYAAGALGQRLSPVVTKRSAIDSQPKP